MIEKGNIGKGLERISEHWRPKIIAEINDHELKLVKVKGVFPWHIHAAEDELFLVWKGQFTVEFRDQKIVLNTGDFCKVPKGVEHRTMAEEEAEILIFETTGVRNTGDLVDEVYTAPMGIKLENL